MKEAGKRLPANTVQTYVDGIPGTANARKKQYLVRYRYRTALYS
jgi:hypothetical protein